MAGGITAAAVWVDVIPSMRGAAREISRQARTMGADTGKALADETSRSISQNAGRLGGALRSTFTSVQQAAVTAGQRVGAAFSGGITAAQAALGRFRTGWSALDSATANSAGRLGRFGASARAAFDTAAAPVQNFVAGMRSSDAAASALTGRMGTLGGRARAAFDTAAAPVQNFMAGMRSSDAAASTLTGRMGTLGGATRSALATAAAPMQNFVSGFRSSDAAASAFTGRMGTLGGATRSAFATAAAPVQNFVSGLRSSDAAASAFTGRMGTLGGTVRSTMTGVGTVTANALRGAAQPLNNFVAGFQNSSAAASAFSGRMGTVGGAVRSALGSAQAGFSNFTSQVRDQAAQIETSVSGGIGGSMRGIAAQAGGLAAAAGFATLGAAAVSSASSIENTELTLKGLYGSAEAAGDMMGRLKNLAAGSPIDYQAYARASTQLAYMGFQGEQAEGILRNVGAAITAAGGDSTAMDRATAAMLQMVNSGRVYAAQLNQISDAGIPVFSALAAHFNTNIENVRTMVTEGKVSIEDVMAVIEQGSGDTFQSMLAASDQVTGSMSNQWAIFRDNVITGLGQMLVPLTTAAGPAIASFGKSLGDALGRIPEILASIGQTWWFQGIVAGFSAIWQFAQPVLAALGQLALVVAGGAFAAFGAVLGVIGNALALVLPYLEPLQPLIFGLVTAFVAARVAMLAYNTATAISAGVMAGYRAATVGATIAENSRTIATRAGAAAQYVARGAMLVAAVAAATFSSASFAATMAQWGFNSALLANPITWVVVALIALVAAVIYAYQNFEWFRNIVQGAWAGIQTAASWAWTVLQAIFAGIGTALTWVWQSVFVPAGNAIVAVWNAIGFAANWLWTVVLSPVLNAIGIGLQYLGAIVFTILALPFILAFNLIAAVATWLWTAALLPTFNAIMAGLRWLGSVFTWLYVNVVLPVWNGIAAAISFAYYSLILPLFNALMAGIRFVGSVFSWLYYNVVVPVWTFIGRMIQLAWLTVILPTYNALVAGIQWVASIFTWLYQNIVLPLWTALGSTISWVWANVISPAFEAVKLGLQWVGEKFDQVTNWIGQIWNKIRGFLAKPINFMINTVWNAGIVPAWNAVAAILPGVDPIAPQQPIPEARTGGRLDSRGMIRGPGSGVSDSVLAQVTETDEPLAVSNREFVVNAAATRRHLPLLTALNGGAEIGDRRNERRGLRGLAGGGPVGWQDLWATVRGQFPNARLTSAKRNSNDFHGAGTAIDVAGPRSMDMPFMLNVNRWLGGAFPQSAELIHTQPGAVNLKNGRPHTYNAATRAGHANHVHWANNGGEGGEGGGLWGMISTFFRDQVENLFVKATDPMLDAIRGLLPAPPPVWNKVPAETAVTMRDKLKEWLFSKADEQDAAAGAGGGGVDISGISGPVVDQVRQVAARYGWGEGAQWDAIMRLVQKESGWNPGAANPTSSARGLFQKMTSIHGGVEPTPAGQANWGLNYIRGRYGSPTAALAFHNANNHYDTGGVAYGRGVLFKDVIAPERVLPPRETQSYETLTRLSQQFESGVVRIVPSRDDSSTGSGRGDGGVHLHVHGDIHDPVDVDTLGQRIEFATRGARF